MTKISVVILSFKTISSAGPNGGSYKYVGLSVARLKALLRAFSACSYGVVSFLFVPIQFASPGGQAAVLFIHML